MTLLMIFYSIVFCPHLYQARTIPDPQVISWRLSSGLELVPMNKDQVILSHLIVPFKLQHPRKPLERDFAVIWNQVPELFRPHLISIWNTTLLQALYPSDVYPEIQSVITRTKRSSSWQHYNPLAYIGWLQSKIFGTAHSFDLEDLQVSSENLSKFVDTLRNEITTQKSIIGDYFGSITQTETQLNHELSQLRNSTQLALLSITGELQVSRAVELLQSRILVYLLEKTLYSEVIMNCQGNKLSDGMIDGHQLIPLLEKLKTRLPNNTEFSIPISEISQYYMEELVHCLIGLNEIVVNLAVPFSRNQNENSDQIFSVNRVPYLHLNRTCWVIGTYPEWIAVSKKSTQLIALKQEFCQITSSRRKCYYRELDFDFSESPRCLLSILQPISISDLTQLCRMECTPHPGWFGIVKLNSSTWYVSWQLFPVELYSLNGTLIQRLPQPHSPIMISITLTCGVFGKLQSGKVLLGQTVNCHKKTTWLIKYHLPIWSINYTELMLPANQGYLDLPALNEHGARIKGHLSFQEKELDKYLSLNITQEPVPTINWTSPWTHTIIWTILISLLLVAVLLTILKNCRSKVSNLPFLGALSSVPIVKAEDGALLSIDVLTDAITLLILIGALYLIYKKLTIILKKRRCHDTKLPNCRLTSPAHMDLILPLSTGYLRIAVADLPLPATYYNPQGYSCPEFRLEFQNGKTYCQLDSPILLPDVIGGTSSVPEKFTLPGRPITGQGTAIITVSDNY